MKTASLLSAVAFLSAGFLAPCCYGGVIISGDVTTGTGVLTISQDITFDITADGSVEILVFDEWGAPNDGTADDLNASFPGTISFVLNGNDSDQPLDFILDNLTATSNQVTPNDAAIGWSPFSVMSGDVLTIKSGSWAIPTFLNWNPATTGAFEGDLFLTDNTGVQISSLVSVAAVPEPSSLCIFGLLAIGIASTRKRHA